MERMLETLTAGLPELPLELDETRCRIDYQGGAADYESVGI